ncbi:hypothetical protein ACQ4WX_38280 [Streptomyces lasalocidi]
MVLGFLVAVWTKEVPLRKVSGLEAQAAEENGAPAVEQAAEPVAEPLAEERAAAGPAGDDRPAAASPADRFAPFRAARRTASGATCWTAPTRRWRRP